MVKNDFEKVKNECRVDLDMMEIATKEINKWGGRKCEARLLLKEKIGGYLDIDTFHDLSIPFIHSCEKSPIETCVYNKFDDPSMDECLFCKEPYERK